MGVEHCLTGTDLFDPVSKDSDVPCDQDHHKSGTGVFDHGDTLLSCGLFHHKRSSTISWRKEWQGSVCHSQSTRSGGAVFECGSLWPGARECSIVAVEGYCGLMSGLSSIGEHDDEGKSVPCHTVDDCLESAWEVSAVAYFHGCSVVKVCA